MRLDARRVTLLLAVGLILAALVIFLINAATPPAVTVEWSTASELNTAGFNVLRSDTPAGPFARLNREIIPASPDPLVGGESTSIPTRPSPPAGLTTISWKKSNPAEALCHRAWWSSPHSRVPSQSSSPLPLASPS